MNLNTLNPSGVDAVIVDLDGTMVDTMGDFNEALNRMLRDLSLPAIAADRLVIAHRVEKLNAERITFTPKLINAAHEVMFIVNGASKAAMLDRVLNGLYRPNDLPSQIVMPVEGRLVWMVG
mgnify:CR=1 FL=1